MSFPPTDRRQWLKDLVRAHALQLQALFNLYEQRSRFIPTDRMRENCEQELAWLSIDIKNDSP